MGGAGGEEVGRGRGEGRGTEGRYVLDGAERAGGHGCAEFLHDGRAGGGFGGLGVEETGWCVDFCSLGGR